MLVIDGTNEQHGLAFVPSQSRHADQRVPRLVGGDQHVVPLARTEDQIIDFDRHDRSAVRRDYCERIAADLKTKGVRARRVDEVHQVLPEVGSFSFGIDLGTSNSAVAIEDFAAERSAIVEMTQLLASNRVGEKPTLPSALYIPHPEEFPSESLKLPWAKSAGGPIVGYFARAHGALVPDRLVVSAKSWLSNIHVDPKKPVLPWKSPSRPTTQVGANCQL